MTTTTIQINIETKNLLEYIKGWMMLNKKTDKNNIGDTVEIIAQYYNDKVIEKGGKK